MEREKYLKSVKDNLEAAGFSVDDLVQFITEKAANSVQKFPFEVMYEGMVRGWFGHGFRLRVKSLWA